MNNTMRQSTQKLLQQRLMSAIVLPIVLLLLLSGIFISQTLHLLSALSWVDHTDRVISQANLVQKLLIDIETSNRGYLLTGDPAFLAPYEQARTQIDPELNELRRLVRDNPQQSQRAAALLQQQTQWIAGVPQVLALVESDRATLRSSLLSRKQQMDAMRRLMTDFIAIEEQLRDDRVQTVRQTTNSVVTSSLGFSLAIGATLAYFSGRQLQKVARTYRQMVDSLQQSLDDRTATETALSNSEAQIQENYTLLQSVINGTTDAIFMKDREGRLRLANARTAQILGRPVQELLGAADDEVLPPEVARDVTAFDRRVMSTGRSQVFEESVPVNGEIRTFLSTKDPYVDAQGNIAGIIGISRDITDRKRVEAQQQKSAQRLAALQAIDRAILRLDAPHDIAEAALIRLLQTVSADQAAVMVVDLEQGQLQVLGGTMGGDPAGTIRAITDNVSTDVLLNREAVWYIKDLSTLVQIQQVPLWDRLIAEGYRSFIAAALMVEGNFTGDLVLTKREVDAYSAEDLEIVGEVANQLAIALQQSQLRDQLQRYASELEQRVAERTAKLEATNQELEAFTYSVSHDLRAPLRTMQGFAQALMEDYADQLDDLAKSYIESIVEDAVQMSDLIADLLAYSRLGRTQINPQPVDLREAIQDALKQLSAEIQEKQAEVFLPKFLPLALAHRSTLVQVLANLISNSIKFVEQGILPRIRIYTEADQHNYQPWVRLIIEDNGIGIAPEHQERIFRVFERLHGVESYPGTGIGLAIVRKGLERMGGRVGVESALGQGSRFWIALPQAVLSDREANDSTHPTAAH